MLLAQRGSTNQVGTNTVRTLISRTPPSLASLSVLRPLELFLLVARFLEAGPCQRAAEVGQPRSWKTAACTAFGGVFSAAALFSSL